MDSEYISDIFFRVIFVLLVIILVLSFFYFAIKDLAENKTCKDYGYKNKFYASDIPSCEDKSGNIHFVKFNCKGYIPKCTLKEITVGDVTGVLK